MNHPETPTGWRSTSGQAADHLPPGPAGTPGPPGSDGRANVGRPVVTVASYRDYASAQRAVDFLSDHRFPVERTSIVGTDLSLVETVLSRQTTTRAALTGAAAGAWFGLFIGLLFGIFTVVNWANVVVTAVVIGGLWGAIFGGVAHGMSGGLRDFNSTTSLRAGEYAVNVDADVAEQARRLLAQASTAATPGG